MLERLRTRWRQRRGNAALVDRAMGEIASGARHPALYTRLGVADTVWGRFEMMALHVHLFQHRAREGGEPLKAMAQELVDAYFQELDSTLRELGIGDSSMPKRMKKIGRMVYGRWEAYGAALGAGDADALAEALRRNAYAEGGDPAMAPALAAYAFAARDGLAVVGDERFLAGHVPFPTPRSAEPDGAEAA